MLTHATCGRYGNRFLTCCVRSQLDRIQNRARQSATAGKTVVRRTRETTLYRSVERWRNRRGKTVQSRRSMAGHVDRTFTRRLTGKRTTPHQRLIDHHRQRKLIRAGVDWLTDKHLQRHIPLTTQDHAGTRKAFLTAGILRQPTGNAKITQKRVPGLVK